MPLRCTNCGRETAERDPGDPCAIEHYVCRECGADFFVHCNYLVDAPPAEKVQWFSCSFHPSSAIAAAKEYIKLKRVVKEFNPYRPGNLEKQYESRASTWNIGSLPQLKAEQLVREAAAVGLRIECCLEPAT
jgi:hypothetical protein